MILTVTMNPSIDISYKLVSFKLDEINRVDKVSKTAGGKGLNVTRVVELAGKKVLATGVLGGKLGEDVEKKLEESNIKSNFYKISGETRNCIAILHDNNQTEVLESGPTLSDEECEGFLAHFDAIISQNTITILTISGSLPKGCTSDLYKDMIRLANKKDIPVVLDTSGKTLSEILEDDTLKITVIKPNREEILEIESIYTSDEIKDWKKLLNNRRYKNVEWIVVSMGAQGAYAKHKASTYSVEIPKISVVNPVGSGDSTVAGLAIGLDKKLSDKDLLKTAMAFGILNTLEDITGHINMDNFDYYFNQVIIRNIN